MSYEKCLFHSIIVRATEEDFIWAREVMRELLLSIDMPAMDAGYYGA
jgi:hypothetical protein